MFIKSPENSLSVFYMHYPTKYTIPRIVFLVFIKLNDYTLN